MNALHLLGSLISHLRHTWQGRRLDGDPAAGDGGAGMEVAKRKLEVKKLRIEVNNLVVAEQRAVLADERAKRTLRLEECKTLATLLGISVAFAGAIVTYLGVQNTYRTQNRQIEASEQQAKEGNFASLTQLLGTNSAAPGVHLAAVASFEQFLVPRAGLFRARTLDFLVRSVEAEPSEDVRALVREMLVRNAGADSVKVLCDHNRDVYRRLGETLHVGAREFITWNKPFPLQATAAEPLAKVLDWNVVTLSRSLREPWAHGPGAFKGLNFHHVALSLPTYAGTQSAPRDPAEWDVPGVGRRDDGLAVVSPKPKEVFAQCWFENVNFSAAKLSNLRFQDCHFVDCSFFDTALDGAEFISCTFQGHNAVSAYRQLAVVDHLVTAVAPRWENCTLHVLVFWPDLAKADPKIAAALTGHAYFQFNDCMWTVEHELPASLKARFDCPPSSDRKSSLSLSIK